MFSVSMHEQVSRKRYNEYPVGVTPDDAQTQRPMPGQLSHLSPMAIKQIITTLQL